MIYIGIDDTDIVGSPGTNQLARAVVARLGPLAARSMICRHQLFFDPRVPYTSKNGSASILLPDAPNEALTRIIDEARAVMRGWFVEGSDPGLCVATTVPESVPAFGRRCQHEVIEQREARAVAAANQIHLEALGGTEQGIIGALAAVGLASAGNDGRVVQLASWPYPDDVSGPQDLEALLARGVEEIRELSSNAIVRSGPIDIGKRLRPNVRNHRVVLFVTACDAPDRTARWQAVKLP